MAAIRTMFLNAATMGAGQAVHAGCQWAILVVLARLGGVEMVGEFALALAITTPVMLFANLSLRPALVTDMGSQQPVRRYGAVRLATSAAGLCAIVAVAWAFGAERHIVLVVMLGLAKACEAQSDILNGVAQRQGRFDLIAISIAARGVLGALGLTTVVWQTGDLALGVLALAVAWALVLVVYDLPVTALWRRQSLPAGTPRSWLPLVSSVLPLGLAALLMSLNVYVPRYVIAERFGVAELGVFAAMAYFVIAGGLINNVFGQAASPRLAQAHVDGDGLAFARIIGAIGAVAVALGLSGVLVATAFHEQTMSLLYGAAFAAQSSLLIWMMVVLTLSGLCTCLGYGVTALRMFRPAPLLHGITLATNVAGCFLLVDHGVLGVMIAWIASLVVNVTVAAVLIVRRWHRLSDTCRSGRASPPLTVSR